MLFPRSLNNLNGHHHGDDDDDIQNLYCLQAHLEALLEAAAINAARLLNNLEFLAGVRISTKVSWDGLDRVRLCLR